MTTLSFWLEVWQEECCGPIRKVGDTVEVNLCLDGEVRPTDEAPRFECDNDGRSDAVGEIDKKVGAFTGFLIHAPGVTFAVLKGNPPSQQALCFGKLWEERHGPEQWPSQAINVGRLDEIWFHPLTGNGESDGVPIRIYNTSKRPERKGNWALRFVLELEEAA